jgi:hypothetical protein
MPFSKPLRIILMTRTILTLFTLRACLKSFDKRRREADNKEKQAGVGGNASISK